jgi:hypothetical protein
MWLLLLLRRRCAQVRSDTPAPALPARALAGLGDASEPGPGQLALLVLSPAGAWGGRGRRDERRTCLRGLLVAC